MTATAQSTLADWRRKYEALRKQGKQYRLHSLLLKAKIEGGEEIAALKGTRHE